MASGRTAVGWEEEEEGSMDGDAREGKGGVTWVPKRSRRCVWDVGLGCGMPCGRWCVGVVARGMWHVGPGISGRAAVGDGGQMFSAGAKRSRGARSVGS